jgi:predicted nuclease with TOPRIM domain
MRARLTDEVDDLRNRLAEVEERLDFAERLLAQGRQADQLSAGEHQ